MSMLLTALALVQAAPMDHSKHAMPKPSEPVCVRAGDLPPAFARWNATPSATLTIGAPFVAVGSDPAVVKWATGRSARAGKAAVVPFTVARPGIYRIGLGAGAWIDVVRGGKALLSVAHGHGPLCTGLRKIVDFKLAAGTYALQLAGMPGDDVKVMVVAK